MRIIAWGSYDVSKPRVRLLLSELRKQDAVQAEINMPVWNSIRDKAVAGPARLLKALARLAASYPRALVELTRRSAGNAILLPYPAIPDVFLAWPIAKLRKHRLIFDAFIPLHDTVVADRGLIRAGGLAAKLLWCIERWGLGLADLIIVDTDQHGDFFSREFGIERERFQTILVGAEPAFWEQRSARWPRQQDQGASENLPTVLFYGQLIPLHGIDTILEAIQLTSSDPLRWLLIGSGQEEPKLRRFLQEHRGGNVTWVAWVNYQSLPRLIAKASIALGIFGTSDKAARVIPNKVFQILATGTPLVTRSSPAMNELAKLYPDAILTVPAGDGAALADAVRQGLDVARKWRAVPVNAEVALGPSEGVQCLLNCVSTLQGRYGGLSPADDFKAGQSDTPFVPNSAS